MVAVIVALFVPTECPVGGGGGVCGWGIFGNPLKRAIWNTLGLHAVLTTCLIFSSVSDGPVFLAASFCQQAATMLDGAYKSSASHLDQQQTPVLIRDDKIKWLDFGTTPAPENLQPHPG